MTVLDRRRFLELCAAAALAPAAHASPKLRVVVAGAGIIGASVAWHLAKAGAEVTVIDREGPATHASRGSFAWINATWSKQPRAYHALNQAGVAGWRRLQPELKLPVRWGGSLEGNADASLETELVERVAEQRDWSETTRCSWRACGAGAERGLQRFRQVVFETTARPIRWLRPARLPPRSRSARGSSPMADGRRVTAGRSRGAHEPWRHPDRLVLATGAAADATAFATGFRNARTGNRHDAVPRVVNACCGCRGSPAPARRRPHRAGAEAGPPRRGACIATQAHPNDSRARLRCSTQSA
jgi:glycine/D-amino acid oxidase-like deaminating enzyme